MRTLPALIAGALACLVVSGLAPLSPAGAQQARSSRPAPHSLHPRSQRCHARGHGRYVLPDRHCTPGAWNPAVTQATIATTICRDGWTATVRPPEAYTEALKWRQMQAYGERGPMHRYEEDHLVPLELGGAPASARNLWPERGAAPNPKDAVEDQARYEVCHHKIGLDAARRAITRNWIAFGERLGVLSAADVATNRRVVPRW